MLSLGPANPWGLLPEELGASIFGHAFDMLVSGGEDLCKVRKTKPSVSYPTSR